MTSNDSSFASEAYLHAKSIWKGVSSRRRSPRGSSDDPQSAPFSRGRDPKPLSAVLAIASNDMGWATELEQATLISDWPKLVGERTAPHTEVVELRDGILIVQCDSTAWATELRRMRAQILTRIVEHYPNSDVQDLRFLAPGAPRWRYGSRVVRGRGPRDTFG